MLLEITNSETGEVLETSEFSEWFDAIKAIESKHAEYKEKGISSFKIMPTDADQGYGYSKWEIGDEPNKSILKDFLHEASQTDWAQVELKKSLEIK